MDVYFINIFLLFVFGANLFHRQNGAELWFEELTSLINLETWLRALIRLVAWNGSKWLSVKKSVISSLQREAATSLLKTEDGPNTNQWNQ